MEENNNTTVVSNPLPTHRGFVKWLLLTIITFGIYDLYSIHVIGRETNVSCAADGKKTRGLAAYILFSILTLGIYGIVWHVLVCDRFQNRLEKAGQKSPVSAVSWVLWNYVGALILVGPCVAKSKLFQGLNRCNELYNQGK